MTRVLLFVSNSARPQKEKGGESVVCMLLYSVWEPHVARHLPHSTVHARHLPHVTVHPPPPTFHCPPDAAYCGSLRRCLRCWHCPPPKKLRRCLRVRWWRRPVRRSGRYGRSVLRRLRLHCLLLPRLLRLLRLLLLLLLFRAPLVQCGHDPRLAAVQGGVVGADEELTSIAVPHGASRSHLLVHRPVQACTDGRDPRTVLGGVGGGADMGGGEVFALVPRPQKLAAHFTDLDLFARTLAQNGVSWEWGGEGGREGVRARG